MEVFVRPCFVQAQGQGRTVKNHALPLERRGRKTLNRETKNAKYSKDQMSLVAACTTPVKLMLPLSWSSGVDSPVVLLLLPLICSYCNNFHFADAPLLEL